MAASAFPRASRRSVVHYSRNGEKNKWWLVTRDWTAAMGRKIMGEAERTEEGGSPAAEDICSFVAMLIMLDRMGRGLL